MKESIGDSDAREEVRGDVLLVTVEDGTTAAESSGDTDNAVSLLEQLKRITESHSTNAIKTTTIANYTSARPDELLEQHFHEVAGRTSSLAELGQRSDHGKFFFKFATASPPPQLLPSRASTESHSIAFNHHRLDGRCASLAARIPSVHEAAQSWSLGQASSPKTRYANRPSHDVARNDWTTKRSLKGAGGYCDLCGVPGHSALECPGTDEQNEQETGPIDSKKIRTDGRITVPVDADSDSDAEIPGDASAAVCAETYARVKRWRCELCDKAFYVESQQRAHFAQHVECPAASCSFTAAKKVVARHQAARHGVRSTYYCCNACGVTGHSIYRCSKKLTRSELLAKQQLMFEGKYKVWRCEPCRAEFAEASQLTSHCADHVKCAEPACEFAAVKSVVRRHVQAMHRAETALASPTRVLLDSTSGADNEVKYSPYW